MTQPLDRQAVLNALPPGVVSLAAKYMAQAMARLEALGGNCLSLDKNAVRDLLLLPLEHDPDWPAPAQPIPVGRGAVHADLTEEDNGVFARLRQAVPTEHPEELAQAAQEWRLPVTPYRDKPAAVYRDSVPETGDILPRPLASLHVLDLTALWAGPLATMLLRRAGIRVTKLDPACRPDGLREKETLYQALNGGKQKVDWDLRKTPDRQRFEALVKESDLVIDSFSRRVMPNLGYSSEELRRINPKVATLSIVAFPDGSPERDWVAYGSGVHAMSGLAEGGPPPLPYPDPLAGLRAFEIALGLLGLQGERPHVEISLLGSLAPLMEKRLCVKE